MTVVGRHPPPRLVEEARRRGYAWTFTGWVLDTRSWVWDSEAFVIPLRVGGGTRLKVWEAMAMGSVVVSTRLGVEGLPVEHERTACWQMVQRHWPTLWFVCCAMGNCATPCRYQPVSTWSGIFPINAPLPRSKTFALRPLRGRTRCGIYGGLIRRV